LRVSNYRRSDVLARGNDAARKLRKELRRAGRFPCAECGIPRLASGLDVDHIHPLALGGEDVAENVQALCKPCHKAKTREDFGATNTPF
jgi:5-methylcytosine-specific restriction protein A